MCDFGVARFELSWVLPAAAEGFLHEDVYWHSKLCVYVIIIRFQACNPAFLTRMLHQVVSNKMVKSVLVSVARWKVFPKYKVRKRWTKKFMVSCSLATSLLSVHAAVCCV